MFHCCVINRIKICYIKFVKKSNSITYIYLKNIEKQYYLIIFEIGIEPMHNICQILFAYFLSIQYSLDYHKIRAK